MAKDSAAKIIQERMNTVKRAHKMQGGHNND